MPGIDSAKARCWRAFLAALLIALLSGPVVAQAKSHAMDRLTIVVPGVEGGGWDLTAEAIKRSVLTEGLARSVVIERYPGGGGLLGISWFSERFSARSDTVMVGGLAMIGASLRDESAVSLADVQPVARLTGDWDVIAVPAGSAIRSVADLRRALESEPSKHRWIGGALAGPDQALVWAIAEKLRISVDQVPYFAKGGGARVGEELAKGHYSIGVSGYAELEPFVRSGAVRIIAVAGPRRLKNLEIPTLAENGIGVSVINWRGVFAPPRIAPADRKRLEQIFAEMRSSISWQRELANAGWLDYYLESQKFAEFSTDEQGRWSKLMSIQTMPGRHSAANLRPAWLTWLQVFLVVLAIGSIIVGLRLRRISRIAREEARLFQEQTRELSSALDGVQSDATVLVKLGVDEDFSDWRLSDAEKDIAWFMLRGLPFKQIATVRGTSERTVRQQAQAIYRKAGLDGRSDLAGRVLERFI